MLCHWATKARIESGDDLLSRAVASQVPSACWGLTSVFGMGTGGSLRLLSPEILRCSSFLFAFAPSPLLHLQNYTGKVIDLSGFLVNSFLLPFSTQLFRSSPRPISIINLHTLPHFQLWPINLIVFEGSYLLLAVAILFSRWASRLDAFSVYPFRTSLPCYALGRTTVSPEVRPSRSSRTRDSSCQNSCAHDG